MGQRSLIRAPQDIDEARSLLPKGTVVCIRNAPKMEPRYLAGTFFVESIEERQAHERRGRYVVVGQRLVNSRFQAITERIVINPPETHFSIVSANQGRKAMVRRIIVVESLPSTMDKITNHLSRSGIEVIEAKSLEQAKRLVHVHKDAAVICAGTISRSGDGSAFAVELHRNGRKVLLHSAEPRPTGLDPSLSVALTMTHRLPELDQFVASLA